MIACNGDVLAEYIGIVIVAFGSSPILVFFCASRMENVGDFIPKPLTRDFIPCPFFASRLLKDTVRDKR